MKLSVTQNRRGFTLIEMVGVLSVIAILAALLVPKVFAAINEARLNNVVASYNTTKSASTGYYVKYGRYGGTNGVPLSTQFGANQSTNWDATVLLPEGLLERPFGPRIGDNAWVECLQPAAAGTAVTGTANGSYCLDGNGGSAPTTQTGNCGAVVECVIERVGLQDAIEISKRIDGDTLSELALTHDYKGRVKYNDPVNGLTTVYLYIGAK